MDQPSSTESTAITLRIRFKTTSLDEFINRYGTDVSPGGIFIRTKQPVEVGTSLQFDFTLADGSPLLAGLGTVAWVRESDPARANNVPGMGLRFDKLSLESQHTHQAILAEKARKEGKSLSTPYPPTTFVAPATRPSPAPEGARPVVETAAKPEPGPTNFAVTRPAPASVVNPAPPAAAMPAAPVKENTGDSDEFESAGKTEISDKPLDYYLKEAARDAEAGRDSIGKTAEQAVPTSVLEDWNTDSEAMPATKSGPPPADALAQESSLATAEEQISAPAKPASGERKTGNREAFASLLDLGAGAESVEEQAAAPTEVLEEISAGAPIEEATSEKTEEVSISPAKLALAAPEPFDLGGSPIDTDRPPSRDRVPSLKPRSSGKRIAGIAVFAAALAFGAVYLATTKPWQQSPQPESQPVPAVTPAPTLAPAPAVKPVVPAPEPARKAVAEEAKSAAVGTAAEKGEPQKPVVEKPAAEKPSEKPSDEKPVVAKAEPETPAGKSAGKSASKAGGKSGEETSSTGGEGEVYRVAFKTVPIGAEVLIDGEYFGRTPCDRRVLDPKKSVAITFRHEGYEPYDRVLGPSDNWVKKGNDRILTITANLKKAKKPAAGEGGPSAAPVGPEGKTEKASEPASVAKPEAKAVLPPEPAKPTAPAASKPEPAKPTAPAASKPEPAKPAAPAASKPEPAKPAAPAASKPEPAKPAAGPTEKPAVSKPAPNFEEPGKAKE